MLLTRHKLLDWSPSWMKGNNSLQLVAWGKISLITILNMWMFPRVSSVIFTEAWQMMLLLLLVSKRVDEALATNDPEIKFWRNQSCCWWLTALQRSTHAYCYFTASFERYYQRTTSAKASRNVGNWVSIIGVATASILGKKSVQHNSFVSYWQIWPQIWCTSSTVETVSPWFTVQVYVSVILKYIKEFSVKFCDAVMYASVDDKAIIPIGEPGLPVYSGVRGHNRSIVFQGPLALDHDFHAQGVVPSVSFLWKYQSQLKNLSTEENHMLQRQHVTAVISYMP